MENDVSRQEYECLERDYEKRLNQIIDLEKKIKELKDELQGRNAIIDMGINLKGKDTNEDNKSNNR